MTTGGFAIEHVARCPGQDTLRLYGEIDAAAASIVFEALATMTSSLVVVDLSGVGFIDCSGIGTLIRCKKSIEQRGQDVVLTGDLMPLVRKIFDALELSSLLRPLTF